MQNTDICTYSDYINHLSLTVLKSFAINGKYVTANTAAAAALTGFLLFSATNVPAISPIAKRQNFTTAKSLQVLFFA